ncbi:MAG: hypothetical protein H3C64_03445 [Candidatus Kuenenia stuttgartiensis]|nr:hypothetical protein [Candidatus Kuenenia stuttgartiensis]
MKRNIQNKLSETEVVNYLCSHLQKNGWEILGKCLGFERGIDVEACKDNIKLLVEAKGAKANDGAHNKKRSYFSGGQIKTHFGKAIVKALELKISHPKNIVAIAHPDDELIRKHIGGLTPMLKGIGVKHFWVTADNIIED